ncbi:329_t:CDS:10 [Acaulospora colombiana]|uniref:329_t:CDS:1 n=1 Tax=Acaulospora colombiana TaxID=27376 RepID=A0ACA9KWA0_9GLOM|nr:329_t:CDS:10 [Acaulospora colombiana]
MLAIEHSNEDIPRSEIIRRISNSARGAGVADAVAQASFNEKKWVWIEDKNEGYVAGYITKEMGEQVEVHLNDGSVRFNNDLRFAVAIPMILLNLMIIQIRIVGLSETEKMNPPKFDKVEDMADLTHLNEASTYSGLFLVAVNPYQKFPIYTDEIIRSYKNRRRREMPPHIYAVADAAYRNILLERESGAGKTENTKKVIQYIAAIASDSSGTKKLGKLEQQILQANPILEAFGNAQTIRNNNSSRFGKFIRIEFNSAGQIAGANIERYLLEKSRVTYQTSSERNFHIFYQLLKGASPQIRGKLLLDGQVSDYKFTKHSRKDIDGVDDAIEFQGLVDAMNIVGISQEEQMNFFRTVAIVLHLGNIDVTSNRDDQAQILETSVVEKVCHLLEIPMADFIKGILRPQVKAGREWITQARTREQVLYSIEALAKSLYERSFGALVDRINRAVDRPSNKANFIGVLDIAGFEIFETNSFEQLCINYTNEKLQQFFNHHMFVLEQEEYRQENIEWKFIDFGLDLQPTIDLIDKVNPVGILSCLDEECVMPKATDKTFVEKLHSLWKDKSSKYQVPRFHQGFILQHYAAKVEYRTEGWLNKNKDPLNENVAHLLAYSSDKYISSIFSDYLGDFVDDGKKNRVKRGAFRTVGRRHKEQLHSLMQQLYATHPHFVRCIVPNNEKKSGKIDVPLVLDQLRCNGVLEGIRICRAGFPNRLGFIEFRQRYEILTPGIIPEGFMDGREAAQRLLEAFKLESTQYRIGLSKVFFRAGVLAELEEIRDAKLSLVFSKFQAHCRSWLGRKDHKKLEGKLQAVLVIQRNVRFYNNLRADPWWKLFSKVRPMLNSVRFEEQLRIRDNRIRELEEKLLKETEERTNFELANAKLEAEKIALEELLHNERSLTLDKEELLKQTRQREMNLEEEVRDLLEELDELEGQCEQLLRSKKTLEIQMQELGLLNAPAQLLAQKEAEERQKDIIQLERANKLLQAELEEIRGKFDEEAREKQREAANRRKVAAELQDCQLKYEAETIKSAELAESLDIHKAKLDVISIKLDAAELSRLKVEKTEGLLRLQITELEQSLVEISNDKKIAQDKARYLEEQLAELEAKMEDDAVEIADFGSLRSRLQDEFDEERERYKKDIEEIQFSLDQTRKKYQLELIKLTDEIEMERANISRLREENKSLQTENEEILAKFEENHSLNQWRREKERYESQIAELTQLYSDALASHDELQSQVNVLLPEMRNLRTALEDAESQKMLLEKLKRNLEERLEDIGEQYNDASQNKNAAERNITALDKEVVSLRQLVEEQQEMASIFAEKLRKAELAALDAQTELTKEREESQDLMKSKIVLEKQVNELNVRIVDLEAKLMTSPRGIKRLESRLEELTVQLDNETREKNETIRMSRKSDRTIRELQYQLAERDKAKARYETEISKYEQKVAKMRETIEELQNSESALQLSKRRAERETNEAKERSLRLEKEIERMKLRLDRSNSIASAYSSASSNYSN